LIRIEGKNAVWNSIRNNSFTKDDIKLAITHLIKECYFTVGNSLQTIGIPMGIDPAPFWANLYLYKFEYRFMRDLLKSDSTKARKFHGSLCFIDDLRLCLNDGDEFGSSFKKIYPMN